MDSRAYGQPESTTSVKDAAALLVVARAVSGRQLWDEILVLIAYFCSHPVGRED
jgi:hypothetical protein